ncbi:ATP-binding cassette domain-containing protein, partial [Kineosporia sp. A_224]|uniref:ATP-binding cassette domain-containing protein n=1 Tax=Kineosporia sp. A_224 TaxID=1962180 RepID=UPI00117BAE19
MRRRAGPAAGPGRGPRARARAGRGEAARAAAGRRGARSPGDLLEGFDGWDTRVGHGGAGLSAGQRQRLGLARALVRQARLVVLDEPTAHLDTETERCVHATIGRLRAQGRSVVLVAHRPALLALADRVVTVHDGPA